MGRTLDPVMLTSSSDDELASRFTGFFWRSFALGAKLMRLVNQEFSVGFPLRFTGSFTFSHFRSVTEADVSRYIKGTTPSISNPLSS